MTRFWAHAYRQIPPKDSPVAGKVGAAAMIGGSAGVAGVPGPWYLSVPKATKNADSAKKFIKCAYDHNGLGIESSLGLASRISAFEKYQDQPGYESFKPLIETLNGKATATRPATAKCSRSLTPCWSRSCRRQWPAATPQPSWPKQEADPGPPQVKTPRPAPGTINPRVGRGPPNQQKRKSCASPIAASPYT